MEVCSLRDEMSTLKSMGVKLFGISLDTVDSHVGFVKKERLNFPLLSDPTKKVAKAYGVLNESGAFANRVTFIIDPKGILRKVDEDVKPATHGRDLVAALRALRTPRKA